MMLTTYQVPIRLFRISGVSSITAGILLTVGFILHPSGEDATFGTDPMWIPAHAILWAAFLVALLGWIGVYIAHAAKAGNLGLGAFLVIMLGTALASWIFSSDVTFVPVIASESPALFKKIFSTGHTLIGVASVLSWVLGNVLFGISLIRAKMFSSWAGILLIVGTMIIPIAYLTGLSIRVVAIGGGIVAVGQVWLGCELLRIPKVTLQTGA
jgi:hypothetical protein